MLGGGGRIRKLFCVKNGRQRLKDSSSFLCITRQGFEHMWNPSTFSFSIELSYQPWSQRNNLVLTVFCGFCGCDDVRQNGVRVGIRHGMRSLTGAKTRRRAWTVKTFNLRSFFQVCSRNLTQSSVSILFNCEVFKRIFFILTQTFKRIFSNLKENFKLVKLSTLWQKQNRFTCPALISWIPGFFVMTE